MTSRDFAYWLQGFFEISRANKEPGEIELDATQVGMIEQHLAMVFKHEIDPSLGTPEHQTELQKIHDRLSRIEAPINPNKRYTC
jgi:hypothetical protein